MISIFEERFKGGHPNSLGNAVEIVEEVLNDKSKLQALFDCWQSKDELVRLRVASAIKRVCIMQPDWIAPYIDHLQTDIAAIDQASTQWILAILFKLLFKKMSPAQHQRALEILKTNLETHPDWIVICNTMQTLTEWAQHDNKLKTWLIPQLEHHTNDVRNSVKRKANKYLNEIG